MGAADDRRAIEELIERQFRALGWSDGAGPDAAGFAGDFHEHARLYPAARPVAAQTVEEFVDRMRRLAGSSLGDFRERVLGRRVQVFGNVAVAFAGGEAVENGVDVTRMVEAILLVKDRGSWKIVAQAWDAEREGQPLPGEIADQS